MTLRKNATGALRAGTATVAALMIVGLGACGSTKAERGLSGGAIGSGIGAAGAAIVGAPVVGAAVIGGAAGAATGVLTDRDDLDLGDFPGR